MITGKGYAFSRKNFNPDTGEEAAGESGQIDVPNIIQAKATLTEHLSAIDELLADLDALP